MYIFSLFQSNIGVFFIKIAKKCLKKWFLFKKHTFLINFLIKMTYLIEN